MTDHLALIQEFIARKEQVLNLEMRLFILVFALELAFILFYIIYVDKIKTKKPLSVLALTVVLAIFFEMLAINGKLGLISIYLRQMEAYMASLGLAGAVWESRALDTIIFVPGNSFTLLATFSIIVLVCQVIYAVHFTAVCYFNSRYRVRAIVIVAVLIIVFLAFKCMTVDFGKKYPNVFTYAAIENNFNKKH